LQSRRLSATRPAQTAGGEETGHGSIHGTLYQPDERAPLAGGKVTAINVRTGTKYASNGEEYNYTVAHWGITEARFRKHVKSITEEEAHKLVLLDHMLMLITQDDVVHRRVFDPNHRSFVTNFGCYIKAEINGKFKYFAVSRQMVLFAVERRKAWRMLQSKAGVVNKDYLTQKNILAKIDKGELPLADAKARAKEIYDTEFAAIK